MVIEKFPYIFKKFVKSSVALVERNQISEWALVFRYEKFLHPTGLKILKNSPRAKNLVLPRVVGMKKFPYLVMEMPCGNLISGH